ncbi:MAG: nuclear transport factor 2 family protein [Pseudomonadota bacterium]
MQVADDKRQIQELVDNWAIFSDSGNWDAFARCWHDDGFMCATWFQAPSADFIAARRKGFDNGVSIIHFHGGFTCEVAGLRAVSQTKMTISQRAEVEGVLVDVTCTGRFYDFHEKRAGRWGMVRRQPIYEKDRMDAVDPAATLRLDAALLQQFPAGYRHLAYLQSRIGYKVAKGGLPGLKGPEVEQLYRDGAAWLAGAASPGRPQLVL